MKKCVKLFILLMLLSINTCVFAASCPTDTRKLLKNEASKVEYTLDHKILTEPGEGEENIEYAMYDISFLNIGENVALKWSYNGSDYELLDSDKIVGEPQGSTIYIEVVGIGPTPECVSLSLKKFKIKLLDYNPNNKNEECKDYPNFTYCQEFVKSTFDLNNKDVFNEKLDAYKRSKKNSETVQGDKIVSKDNYIGFFLLIFLPVTMVILINKRIKR